MSTDCFLLMEFKRRMGALWWNELVDQHSLLLALWWLDTTLPRDCRSEIVAWLPLAVWSRCCGCGAPLVYSNQRGKVFVSRHATHAFDACSMCYFSMQS